MSLRTRTWTHTACTCHQHNRSDTISMRLSQIKSSYTLKKKIKTKVSLLARLLAIARSKNPRIQFHPLDSIALTDNQALNTVVVVER